MDRTRIQENDTVGVDPNFESTINALANDICMRHFQPSKEHLVSILELLHSYETILHAEIPVARLFKVPLTSDLKAKELGYMFSQRQPHVLEDLTKKTSTVEWADIARSQTYDPVLQEDGSYHLELVGGNTVKLSKFDHDFISTTIPRQIVDPKSYPSDVGTELNAIEFAAAQIASWKDITSQVTQTIDTVLALLSNRVIVLQHIQPQNTAMENSPSTCTLPETPPAKAEVPRSVTGKKRKTHHRGLLWTADEVGNLQGWSEQHQNLSQQAIEEQYFVDTGKRRSFASIQSKLYEMGLGRLSHKKKRPIDGEKTSESVAVPSVEDDQKKIDPVQLSIALGRINGYSHSTDAKVSCDSIDLCKPVQEQQLGRSDRQKEQSLAKNVTGLADKLPHSSRQSDTEAFIVTDIVEGRTPTDKHSVAASSLNHQDLSNAKSAEIPEQPRGLPAIPGNGSSAGASSAHSVRSPGLPETIATSRQNNLTKPARDQLCDHPSKSLNRNGSAPRLPGFSTSFEISNRESCHLNLTAASANYANPWPPPPATYANPRPPPLATYANPRPPPLATYCNPRPPPLAPRPPPPANVSPVPSVPTVSTLPTMFPAYPPH